MTVTSLVTRDTMLYTSLSCESLPRISEFDLRPGHGGHAGHGGQVPLQWPHFSEWPPLHPVHRRQHQLVYKPKKASKGMFKRKKNAEVYGGYLER